MIIHKILNNNVITTIDEDTGLEKVVMGRGIAFKKRKGDRVELSRVEKVFEIENKNENKKFQRLFDKIPLEHISISEKIISYAKSKLDVELDEHIYVALTDHLTFAIKRISSGISIKNHLIWEIKRLYKEEYEIGKWGIRLIKEELGVELPEDEAGFIALHLLNASTGSNMMNTMEATEMVQDILNIVKYYLNVEIITGDLVWERLITHLKYFSHRVLNKRQELKREDTFLQFIKTNYTMAYDCSLKIKAYILKNYNYDVSDEELVYLSLHLQKLISRIENY